MNMQTLIIFDKNKSDAHIFCFANKHNTQKICKKIKIFLKC